MRSEALRAAATAASSPSPSSLLVQLLLLVILSTGLTSTSVGGVPYLLFANKRDIRLYEVSPHHRRTSPRTTVVIRQLEDADALDYFLAANRLCWTEISLSVIRCSDIRPSKNGRTEKETIVGTGVMKPEGLACDWANNMIYWTDSETKRIEVASAQPDLGHRSRLRKVLVWEDIDLPRSIAVAPEDGLMFWTDWGEYPRIERASMDGDPASRTIVVDQDVGWPNGITLDYAHKKLYWVEAKLHYIACVDWDGRNRKTILADRETLPQPFAVSIFRSELYWTDWTTNSLHMYNFTMGIVPAPDFDEKLYLQVPERIKFRGKLTPMDIKVFDPSRQITPAASKSNPCSVNNGGCSHLCLASSSSSLGGYSCACPTGVRLVDDRTCDSGFREMLLLSKRTDLRRVSLDTPDFTDILIPVLPSEFAAVGPSNKSMPALPVVLNLADYPEVMSTNRRRSTLVSSASSRPDEKTNLDDDKEVLDDYDYDSDDEVEVESGGDGVDSRKSLSGKGQSEDEEALRLLRGMELNAVAVDYDPVEATVYWTDQVRGIMRTQLGHPVGGGGGNATTAATVAETVVASMSASGGGFNDHDALIEQPDGIAVDWAGRNVFWTDAGTDRIYVTKLDDVGSLRHRRRRKTVVSDRLDEPRDIALDLQGGWMFWSDWGTSSPAIEKAAMDGRFRQVVVAAGQQDRGHHLVWPNGIALDLAEGRIYWCDAKTDRIESARFDGSDRRVVVSEILPHPFGLALLGDFVYWTDWQENTVERARKQSGEDRRVLISHLDGLMGLQAVATSLSQQDRKTLARTRQWCARCSHLCLMTSTSSSGLNRVCDCPDGMELEGPGGAKCVEPDAFLLYATKSGDIGRMSLKTPDLHGHLLLVRGVVIVEPTSLAVISSSGDEATPVAMVYWADAADRSISRARMDGSMAEVIVEFGLEYPDAVALDWGSGNLYWSDSGLGRISVSKADGSHPRVLLWDDLGGLMASSSHLLVDPEGGHVYWWTSTSSGAVRIERAGLDGSGRETFWHFESFGGGDTSRLTGLALDPEGRRLYWAILTMRDNRFISSQIAFVGLDLQGPDQAETTRKKAKVVLNFSGGGSAVVSTFAGLSVYNGSVYWSDAESQTIEKADKDDGRDRTVVHQGLSNSAGIADFLIVKTKNPGDSAHKVTGGQCQRLGCSQLCFELPGQGQAKCGCQSHSRLAQDGRQCLEPEAFLLYGQKNRISRLMALPDVLGHNAGVEEVPDLMLPVHGPRDIRALAHDPVGHFVYWVDNGAGGGGARRGKGHGNGANRAGPGGVSSIKRSHDNGTLPQDGRTIFFRPDQHGEHGNQRIFDLALDPFSRYLYWSCDVTNVINVTSVEPEVLLEEQQSQGEEDAIHASGHRRGGPRRENRRKRGHGPVVSTVLAAMEGHVGDFRPRHLALHPFRSLLFWTNVPEASPPTIQRSRTDGRDMVVVVPRAPVEAAGATSGSSSSSRTVGNTLVAPSGLVLDVGSDLLYWTDSGKVEVCDVDGGGRRTLLQIRAKSSSSSVVSLSILGDFLYLADPELQTISRVSKALASATSGGDNHKPPEVVLSGVQHLSSLVSASSSAWFGPSIWAHLVLGGPSPKPGSSEKSSTLQKSPCLIKGCSHLCFLVRTSAEDQKEILEAQCSCPRGSANLVLKSDGRTCGPLPSCKTGEFTCASGTTRCIPLQWRCDGTAECSDHSDEVDCPECGGSGGSGSSGSGTMSLFRCRSGQCINSTLICDNVKHCDDSTDETSCCPKDTFQCPISGECLAVAKTCDGHKDCPNGADEILPQCNDDDDLAGESGDAGKDSSSSNLAAYLIGVFATVLVVVVAVLIGVYCRNNGNNGRKMGLSSDVIAGAAATAAAAGGETDSSSPNTSREQDLVGPGGAHPQHHHVHRQLYPAATGVQAAIMTGNNTLGRGKAVGAESDLQGQTGLQGNLMFHDKDHLDGHGNGHQHHHHLQFHQYQHQHRQQHHLPDLAVSGNNGNGTMSSSTAPHHLRNGGSSNGLVYDRSHVTGASSSTTSSGGVLGECLAPPPPPSPATAIMAATTGRSSSSSSSQFNRRLQDGRTMVTGTSGGPSRRLAAGGYRQYGGRHHHHHHQQHPPPPPTPCSTDVNDESESGSVYRPHRRPPPPPALVNNRAMPAPTTVSLNNSSYYGCYDSETYDNVLPAMGGTSDNMAPAGSAGRHRSSSSRELFRPAPPPSTPYMSDYEGAASEAMMTTGPPPPSPTLGDLERTFQPYYAPPPPSPAPSPIPGAEDDDDDDEDEEDNFRPR